MTIAIGFLCQDGIAICTDRQLTGEGGFKFDEGKIAYSANASRIIAFAYAGDPDDARVMFKATTENLETEMARVKAKFSGVAVRKSLEVIFRNRHAKRLQTLIGVRLPNLTCTLCRTSSHRVVEGLTEHIGGGDSSALRYACDLMLEHPVNMDDARILGDYIVSVASRYVDGCSGGPDHITIGINGRIGTGTGGAFPNWRERLMSCEQTAGRQLRELLLSGGTSDAKSAGEGS